MLNFNSASARDFLAAKKLVQENEKTAYLWTREDTLALREKFRREALLRNELYYARTKCLVKGHKWEPSDPVSYALGYDTPVRCMRCGEIDM